MLQKNIRAKFSGLPSYSSNNMPKVSVAVAWKGPLYSRECWELVDYEGLRSTAGVKKMLSEAMRWRIYRQLCLAPL